MQLLMENITQILKPLFIKSVPEAQWGCQTITQY